MRNFSSRLLLDPGAGGSGGETPEQKAAREKAEADAKKEPTTDELKASLAAKSKEAADLAKANQDTANELKKIRDENATIKAAKEKEEADRLARGGDYKTLYENEKKAKEEAEGKTKKFTESFLSTLKRAEVRTEAAKQGIRTEAIADLDILPMDGVAHSLDGSGLISILGAKEHVDQIKASRPFWFTEGGTFDPNNGNNGGKIPAKGGLTPSEILRLEVTDPAKYREEIRKKANAPTR